MPGRGGEGTCTNAGLLYFWVLEFYPNGTMHDIGWKPDATFQLALGGSDTYDTTPCAATGVVPLPQRCAQQTRGANLTIDTRWTILANLSDPVAAFAASSLQANLGAAGVAGLRLLPLSIISRRSRTMVRAWGGEVRSRNQSQ